HHLPAPRLRPRRRGGQEIAADERDAGERAGGRPEELSARIHGGSPATGVWLRRARGCSQTPAASSGGKLRPAWYAGYGLLRSSARSSSAGRPPAPDRKSVV